MTKELNAIVLQSAQELCSRFFSGNASVGTTDIFPVKEITAAIRFEGMATGVILLHTDKQESVTLGKLIGSTICPEDSEAVRNASGEFLNMLIGIAKRRYDAVHEAFSISVPWYLKPQEYKQLVQQNSVFRFMIKSDPLCLLVEVIGKN